MEIVAGKLFDRSAASSRSRDAEARVDEWIARESQALALPLVGLPSQSFASVQSGMQAISWKMTPGVPRRMWAALPGGKKSKSGAMNSNHNG